jgi:hypothetical protein
MSLDKFGQEACVVTAYDTGPTTAYIRGSHPVNCWQATPWHKTLTHSIAEITKTSMETSSHLSAAVNWRDFGSPLTYEMQLRTKHDLQLACVHKGQNKQKNIHL